MPLTSFSGFDSSKVYLRVFVFKWNLCRVQDLFLSVKFSQHSATSIWLSCDGVAGYKRLFICNLIFKRVVLLIEVLSKIFFLLWLIDDLHVNWQKNVLLQVVLEKNANRDKLRTRNPVQITDHQFQQFENSLLHFSVFLWYYTNK